MTADPAPEVTAVPNPAGVAAGPNWERWLVRLVLAVFVAVGLNHIHTNTVYGQDFLLHSTATENLIAHPGQWFPQDFTNRPLLYWIGAGSSWLTHGKAPWEMAAVVFIALNTLALFLMHDSMRRFIRSPWLRTAAVTFAAFLPATQVAVIVYASDAVCQLPFVLTAWSLLRCVEAGTPRARAGYAGLTGLALGLGIFSRFTFLALLPAIAVALVLLWRWRQITVRQSLLIAAAALLGPALLAGWIQQRAREQLVDKSPHHTFNWHGTGEMTWSSLLLVKRADLRILDAPVYWDAEEIDGRTRYGLLVNNRYSYPALLHLSVFTDVLDYANEGQIDDGAIRPEPQKTLARWSVRLGLLFTAAGCLALLWFAARCVISLWRPGLAPGIGPLLWGTLALAWHLPLALALPFVVSSYDWGYWLSRLIIPALWGFSVVLFAAIDERTPRHRWLAGLVTVLVAVQAGIHIRALWY